MRSAINKLLCPLYLYPLALRRKALETYHQTARDRCPNEQWRHQCVGDTALKGGSRPAIRTSHDLPDEFCVRTDFALREVTSSDRDDLADHQRGFRRGTTSAQAVAAGPVPHGVEARRLSRDVHFISGLMAHKVPFWVAGPGP